MSSSLILGPFDLLDPASPVRLLSFDRGGAAPSLSEIQSSVLDGAAVTSTSVGNRQISIPIVVRSSNRVTAATLANQVLTVVDQVSWQLMFTPDGGFPVVYDCYRGTSTVTSDLVADAQGWQSFLITCEAAPYGHSPAPTTLALTGSTAPQTLESFDTTPLPLTGTVYSGAPVGTVSEVTTPTPAAGAKSLSFAGFSWCTGGAGASCGAPGFKYAGMNMWKGTNGGSPLSITSGGVYGAVSFAVRVGASAYNSTQWTGTIIVTTSGGVTHNGTFPAVYPQSTAWATLSTVFDTPIAAGAVITSWVLQVTCMVPSTVSTGSLPTSLFVDSLVLTSSAGVAVSSPQGAVLQLIGVAGTARAPLNLALARTGGGSFTSWLAHSPPADRPFAQPLIPFGGAASGVSYAASGLRYGGTYSVWIASGPTITSAGTARTWSMYPYQNSAIFSPVQASVQAQPNTLYYVGDVVLPCVDFPAESTATFSFAILSSQTADTFNDMLLLDTRGQTVAVTGAAAKANAWVDAPTPAKALGGAWSGTAADRSDAASVAGNLVAASVLFANPGNSNLLVYSPTGALQGAVTYSPRWQQEATQ